MNTHNDFLNNAVDDKLETEGIENLTADVCWDMKNDTEKMCLSLRNGTLLAEGVSGEATSLTANLGEFPCESCDH